MISAGPFRGHQAARPGCSQQFRCHYVLQSCPDVLPVLSRCHLMYSSSQNVVCYCGQKPGITFSGPRCLSHGTSSKSIEKPTSSKDATMSSRSPSMPPKTVTNS